MHLRRPWEINWAGAPRDKWVARRCVAPRNISRGEINVTPKRASLTLANQREAENKESLIWRHPHQPHKSQPNISSADRTRTKVQSRRPTRITLAFFLLALGKQVVVAGKCENNNTAPVLCIAMSRLAARPRASASRLAAHTDPVKKLGKEGALWGLRGYQMAWHLHNSPAGMFQVTLKVH